MSGSAAVFKKLNLKEQTEIAIVRAARAGAPAPAPCSRKSSSARKAAGGRKPKL
jgi:hypothetical protein